MVRQHVINPNYSSAVSEMGQAIFRPLWIQSCRHQNHGLIAEHPILAVHQFLLI
jgi:hypothetical protein